MFGIITQSGHITAESEIDRGTTFVVYLPARLPAGPNAPPARAPDTDARPESTVLVVEDEDALRQLVRQMLEQDGHRVIEAGDGLAALAVSRQHAGHVDLLLTDLVMPSMSGLELATQILQARPTTAVLYMSGYSSDSAVYREVADRGMPLLSKPFSRSTLTEAVRHSREPRALASLDVHGPQLT